MAHVGEAKKLMAGRWCEIASPLYCRSHAHYVHIIITRLLKIFGPIVIIGDNVSCRQTLPLHDVQFARSPYDICVDLYCREFDKAATDLPDNPFDMMR